MSPDVGFFGLLEIKDRVSMKFLIELEGKKFGSFERRNRIQYN